MKVVPTRTIKNERYLLFIFNMRRYNYLYEQVCSKENIELAFNKCIKGKRQKREVIAILPHKYYYINEVQKLLLNKKFEPSAYRTHVIYEPKKRLIYSLPVYPDRIVHHAVMNVLEPIWESMFYRHSYACIKNRGTHAAHLYLEKQIANFNWALQCDIRKFYPSINHQVLKQIFRRKIKDRDLLQLLDKIVDSIDSETNIPIGNYTSQWFGNLYLNELDDFIQHELKLKEVRYCDDFILFSNDRDELKTALIKIKEFLDSKLKLKLSKERIVNAHQGLTAFGFKSFRNRKGKVVTLVKKQTARRIKKFLLYEATDGKLDNINKANKVYRVLTSYNGILSFCKATRFKNKINFNIKYENFTTRGNDMIKSISDYFTDYQDGYLEGEPVSVQSITGKKIFISGVKITKNKYANAANGKNENCAIIQFFMDEGQPEDITRKQKKFIVLSASMIVTKVAEAIKEVDFTNELISAMFKKQGNKIALLPA